jgi:hypothetical protein
VHHFDCQRLLNSPMSRQAFVPSYLRSNSSIDYSKKAIDTRKKKMKMKYNYKKSQQIKTHTHTHTQIDRYIDAKKEREEEKRDIDHPMMVV